LSHFTVVYDACVLYPAPLRDLLMHVALLDLYRAKWSWMIHDEWIGSLLKNRPDLTAEQLQRTRDLMDAHVRDCLVTGFEDLIPAINLPDANDRHVLAAAIRAGADVIVTFNQKHFPAASLQPYGIETLYPDEFLKYQLDLAPNIICTAAKRHRASLKNKPKTVTEYLETLNAQGLAQTVAELRKFAELI
jgi:predicted nucleic acid-binding protein